MSVLRRLTGGALLLLLATFGLSQQTVIITGPRELTGPLTLRVIPPAPAPPPSAPVITTPTPLPDGDQDVPYMLNLLATGGVLPYSWYLAATETLPQAMEDWTPAGGIMAYTETFGDPGCSATDNTWPTPAGLVIVNSGLLTGNCLGRIDGSTTAVAETGLGLSNTWLSFELLYTTLPSTNSTAIHFFRSVPGSSLTALRWRPEDGLQTITSTGGTAQSIFEPAINTRYKIEFYAERGVIAADAKARARVAVWNGTSYDAFGSWVASDNGTWTGLINDVLFVFNTNGGVWYIDTIERCQFGPVSEGFCGGSAPDLYTTPSPIPNNVYVDNSTVPISESLWSHDGTDLTLEIATDPDASTIEVAEKPGGLTLSQAGVLSGTPTADGTLNFTARVCDAVGSCSTKAFSLNINEPPDPTPPGAWVTSFTPARTHYVVASGGCTSGGTCGEIGNPEAAGTAFSSSHYQCGDLHILREGNYLQTFDYHNEFSRNCTSGSPAVWKAFVSSTGQPENAKFRPQINQPGSWNWFVNLHCDGEKNNSLEISCIKVVRAGNHVINTVLHDSRASVLVTFGFNSTTPAPNQITYGNVIYGAGQGNFGAHNIYAQNDVDLSGRKYFVHNILLEPRQVDGGRALFHANDSSGGNYVSGFWLEGNFMGDAVPIGGSSSPYAIWTMASGVAVPNRDINLIDNYFVDFWFNPTTFESVRMGHGIPAQGVFTGNYFARANMSFNGYWGNSGAHDPIVFTDNELYDPPGGVHLNLLTRGATGGVGSHKINNADTWNNNTYGGTFKVASLRCNNGTTSNLTLTQWRTSTDACRVTPGSAGFDLNSTTVANPTVDKVEVIKNQYQCPTCVFNDGAWGFIYAVNWDGNTTVSADISSVVGVGKQYVVRYPRDFFGTAAASGTCPGSGACNVTLPTRRTGAEATGKFANAYVITGEP